MPILSSATAALRWRLLSAVHSRTIPLGKSGPFVSFTFDDFPRTAYTAGGSILKNGGARGTYYVAMGLMGALTEAGEHFLPDDLCSLSADGHELASHTFAHGSSYKMPLDAFQQDVWKGYRAMHEMRVSGLTRNFAYPFGDVTLAAKKALGKEMTSCRGIFAGLNGPRIDLNLLKANPIRGDLDHLPRLERLIRQNEELASWLIFYTHDVRPNPSCFGCTPELLEAVVGLASRHSAAVLPVVEVLRLLQADRA